MPDWVGDWHCGDENNVETKYIVTLMEMMKNTNVKHCHECECIPFKSKTCLDT